MLCFVAINSFGKCLYKEDLSTRSILLLKWDLTQLALDPGQGQTKSVISFPPDFLLGKKNQGKAAGEKQKNEQEQ